MDSRLPLNYSKIPGLKIITAEDLTLIHVKAKSLTLDELYEFLCLEPSMLSDHEQSVFLRAYKRGRAEGIVVATESLFAHMKTRNGGVSALAYLQQHSPNFSSVTAVPNSASPSGFSFNVVMQEDKEDKDNSNSHSQTTTLKAVDANN